MALPLLVPPQQPYAVDGFVLPTQPGIATTPHTTTPYLFAGARFTLLFFAPDTTTQTILASGLVVPLQFALSDGSMTTAQVLLQSTLTGTVFQVDSIVQTTQVIYRWIVQVQAV